MTYCCGVLVRDGLVMIADTRTNAGLDNVSTFRKLHIFSKPGERIMAIASAGNLAISQSVLSTLTEGIEDPHTGEVETLMNAPTMFQAAQRIGRAIRSVHATEGDALRSEDVSLRRLVPVRRPDQGLADAAVHGLHRRQFHRMHHRHALPADRRAQIRQAGARPRHALRRRTVRGAEDQPDLDGFDDALQSRRRPADRRAGGARGCLRGRPQSPHRGGRALFPRSAFALVGGAARGAPEYSKTTLQSETETKK